VVGHTAVLVKLQRYNTVILLIQQYSSIYESGYTSTNL